MGNDMSDSEQSLKARIAANVRWSHTEDRSAATEPAREAAWAKFEAEVDPDEKLPLRERAVRAEAARRAHFQRMALRSAQVRRRRREAG